MKNNLVVFIIKYAFGLLILALFAPLLSFFIFFVLLFLLPFFLLIFIPGTGTKEYRHIPYSQRLAEIGEIVVKSTGMIAAIAILRALTVMLYQYMPPALMVIDTPLILIAYFLDVSSVAVIDYVTGIAGIIILLILTLEDTFWRIAQHRNTNTMPFSRARSVAIGLVKMQGVARQMEKYSNQNVILEHSVIHGSNEKIELHRPFYLEDDTGRVVIETKGANFATETGVYGESASFGQYSRLFPHDYIGTILLPRHKKKHSNGEYVYQLLDGDPVYVMGVAQSRDKDGDSDADIFISPKTGVFGHRHHDVFLLTNGVEFHPEEYFYRGLSHSWLFSLVCGACILWLVFNARAGMTNFEAAYNYKPEVVLEKYRKDFGRSDTDEVLPKTEIPKPVPVTERPLEERCVTLIIGHMCVPEMLERIHTQYSYGDVNTILINLDRLGAVDLAIVELKKMIVEAEDPRRAEFGKKQLERYEKTGTFKANKK